LKFDKKLSERDRAMLRVTEYFVNSLKDGHSDILEKGIRSELVLHCNYVFRTVSEIGLFIVR